MLHLSGMDDRTDSQYTIMHQTEDRILAQIGVGPVFEPQGRRSAQAPPLTASAFPRTATAPRTVKARGRGAEDG
jgi:hypothetical protein